MGRRRKSVEAAKVPQRAEEEQNTRRRLLETAGQVFAEVGFDRATGKDICERAGTNTAAVNYYFGGMDGLYAEVLLEADKRLVTSEALANAVAAKASAREKLEAFLGLIVAALTGPAATSWVIRVIGREVVAPSPAIEEAQARERLQKVLILKGIVAELLGVPPEHLAVARGCISVMAPCFMMLVGDRPTLKKLFPVFSLSSEEAPQLVRHLVQFSLAGLNAIGRELRKESQ